MKRRILIGRWKLFDRAFHELIIHFYIFAIISILFWKNETLYIFDLFSRIGWMGSVQLPDSRIK